MRCAPANPLDRGAGRLGHAGYARGETGWAAPKIQPKSQFEVRNSFSFSNLFYKLQINLNSNQI
jgi:hypothetical protein